ncbi:hypothetical protein [Bdellovibrio sp. HCB209]|uniref:hypothetical protein n=1 Tax=Bdellovibrio sp. HCB209 TaxID=3394354 RepID=UPI0039B6BF78
MTKNSLFLLVVIIVVGFAVWFAKFGQDLKRTQEIVSEQNDDTQRLLRRRTTAAVAEPTVAASLPDNSVRKNQLQQEIQSLSNQLYQENQKLETQQQYIDDIRRRSNPTQTELSYRNQISNATQEISYLTDLLRGDQMSESDIQREAQRLQTEQDTSLRFYQEQMDQNIRDQEALLRNTQEEIAFWNLNNNYINEKQARLQTLQQLLIDQTQQLQNMKVQKLELSARALEQSQAIQTQARQVASDNAQAREETQSEITSLREDIQRLEYAYRQRRYSQMSGQSQAQQAERNLQGQQEVIRSIQELLREKQAQLNQLQ